MSSPDLHWMVGRTLGGISVSGPTSWLFELTDGGSLRVDTLWRIVTPGGIQAASGDHGLLFGLQGPVDSAVAGMRALSGARVRRADVVRDTGDVVLDFDNDARLEILTTSSGFEGWSIVSPTGHEVIGLGGGPITVREA